MKTQNLLRSVFGVAVIAVLLSVVSCDSTNNPSALVGRWVEVSAGKNGEVMELLGDGTGVATDGKMGFAITWKTEGDRIYVTASEWGMAFSYNYKLQGSELTFTKDNGEISIYTKCKKDCKEAAEEYRLRQQK